MDLSEYDVENNYSREHRLTYGGDERFLRCRICYVDIEEDSSMHNGSLYTLKELHLMYHIKNGEVMNETL